MKIKSYLPIFFSLFLMSCSSTRQSTQEPNYSIKNIPPGQCRIVASVIKIDSTLSVGNKNDPCSKAPCTAWIKVKNIVGYGAGSAALSPSDTLKAKFAFTLNPTTKKNFPTLKEKLPGLEQGSSFIADVQLLPSIQANNKKEKVFLIYSYTKIK